MHGKFLPEARPLAQSRPVFHDQYALLESTDIENRQAVLTHQERTALRQAGIAAALAAVTSQEIVQPTPPEDTLA